MIHFLTTTAHGYTHDEVSANPAFAFRQLSYNRAWRATSLPRGTYVFADLDRLGFWELELAARLYRILRAAGVKVLNDPGRVRQRLSLLREMYRRGLNRFDAWYADETSRPERYPVFLRTHAAHRGNLTDLLHDEQQVKQAVEDAIAKGYPLRDLILIEYCAQPIGEKLFRKLATFRVGNKMVSTTCVHESHWSAKYGERGVAPAEAYEDEYAIVEENRWGEPLRPAFEVAGAEYGRADFALVDGTPQVYEINSNPMHDRITEHPFPIRVKADQLFYQRYFEALSEIDTPATGAAVALDDEIFVRQRKRDRLVLRTRWTP